MISNHQPFEVFSKIIEGSHLTKSLIELAGQFCWFQMTPLPDNQYEIHIKNEEPLKKLLDEMSLDIGRVLPAADEKESEAYEHLRLILLEILEWDVLQRNIDGEYDDSTVIGQAAQFMVDQGHSAFDLLLPDMSEDADHPVSEWQGEVANNHTRLCYQDWVIHQQESNES